MSVKNCCIGHEIVFENSSLPYGRGTSHILASSISQVMQKCVFSSLTMYGSTHRIEELQLSNPEPIISLSTTTTKHHKTVLSFPKRSKAFSSKHSLQFSFIQSWFSDWSGFQSRPLTFEIDAPSIIFDFTNVRRISASGTATPTS